MDKQLRELERQAHAGDEMAGRRLEILKRRSARRSNWSITQGFKFENGDLQCIELMLTSIVPILFSRKNGEYTTLHIKTQPKNSSWDDGSSYDGCFDELNFLRKPDGTASELVRDGMYGGAYSFKEGEQFANSDDAARYVNDKHKQPKKPATRVFVAELCDYKPDYKKKNGDIRCRSQLEMVQETMKLLESKNFADLHGELGDGYNDWFNRFDGSVSLGYRLHWQPMGGWNRLLVSLVHLYVGK